MKTKKIPSKKPATKGQGPVPRSADWDVERTHGRLCKVQYDVGCTEADQYCDQLRKEGWKAWSVSSDGKRVTESWGENNQTGPDHF